MLLSVLSRQTARGKTAHRFDFSSRTDRLPRDKSGKELRFDEYPSGDQAASLSLSLSLRHRYPRGPPFMKRGQYRAQQKLHAHLGFAWSAPGWPRRRFPVETPSSLHNAAPLTLRVPLCERPTRCHKGYRGVTPWLKSLSCEVHLPTKPARRGLSAKPASILLLANPQHWHVCSGHLHFSPIQLSDTWNPLNCQIFGAQHWSLIYHIGCVSNLFSIYFQDFPGFQNFLKFTVAIILIFRKT